MENFCQNKLTALTFLLISKHLTRSQNKAISGTYAAFAYGRGKGLLKLDIGYNILLITLVGINTQLYICAKNENNGNFAITLLTTISIFHVTGILRCLAQNKNLFNKFVFVDDHITIIKITIFEIY